MTVENKTTIERRLARLEAQLLPPAPRPTQTLIEPGAEAEPKDRQAFDNALRDALAAGAKVWVVIASGSPADREAIAGVTFVDAEWKAALSSLAQHEDGLEALWARLSGNIFRPAASAAEPDAEAVPGDGVEPQNDDEEAGPSRRLRARWGNSRA